MVVVMADKMAADLVACSAGKWVDGWVARKVEWMVVHLVGRWDVWRVGQMAALRADLTVV